MEEEKVNLDEREAALAPTSTSTDAPLVSCLEDHYVCWLDVMGMQKTMSSSLEKAMNFVLKFHNCIVEAVGAVNQSSVVVYNYPIMDGVYLASSNSTELGNVVADIYNRTAAIFLQEPCLARCFVIRGALAKGKILHGDTLQKRRPTLKFNCAALSGSAVMQQLMVGMPMIQAYVSERNAPPFGVYIHESAREYGKLQGCYYEWWRHVISGGMVDLVHLKQKLDDYFAFCATKKYQLEMEETKIRRYRELVQEYFG